MHVSPGGLTGSYSVPSLWAPQCRISEWFQTRAVKKFLASYAFTRINGAPSPRPHPDSPLMDLWATSPVLFRTYLVYFIWTQTKFKIDSWICCMLLLFLGKHQFLITQHFCSLSPLVSWQCLCMKEWMKVKLRRAVHCETVSLALTKVKASASQQMNYKEPLYEYTVYLNYG